MYVVLRCPLPAECFEGEWPEALKPEELIEHWRQKALTLGVPIQVEIWEKGRRRVLALSPQGIIFEGALFAPHKLKSTKNIKKRGKP